MINLDNRPSKLRIVINENPLQCNIELCLLNEAFRLASIHFSSDDPTCGHQGDAFSQSIDSYCMSGKLVLLLGGLCAFLKNATQAFSVNKTQPDVNSQYSI